MPAGERRPIRLGHREGLGLQGPADGHLPEVRLPVRLADRQGEGRLGAQRDEGGLREGGRRGRGAGLRDQPRRQRAEFATLYKMEEEGGRKVR